MSVYSISPVSSSSSLMRQHFAQPSQRLSHSSRVISSRRFTRQKGSVVPVIPGQNPAAPVLSKGDNDAPLLCPDPALFTAQSSDSLILVRRKLARHSHETA